MTLRGFPDIAGLVPILGTILFVLSTDMREKITFKNMLILGVLLWLPFALRRWYAYSIVVLYLTLPFFNFFIHTLNERKQFKQFVNICIQFFGAGCVSLLLLVIFQKRLFLRVITTDYSHLYSAYAYGISLSFESLTSDLGLYIIPFFVVGLG